MDMFTVVTQTAAVVVSWTWQLSDSVVVFSVVVAIVIAVIVVSVGVVSSSGSHVLREDQGQQHHHQHHRKELEQIASCATTHNNLCGQGEQKEESILCGAHRLRRASRRRRGRSCRARLGRQERACSTSVAGCFYSALHCRTRVQARGKSARACPLCVLTQIPRQSTRVLATDLQNLRDCGHLSCTSSLMGCGRSC